MKLALYFPRVLAKKRLARLSSTPAVELIDADTGEVLGSPTFVQMRHGVDEGMSIEMGFMARPINESVVGLSA